MQWVRCFSELVRAFVNNFIFLYDFAIKESYHYIFVNDYYIYDGDHHIPFNEKLISIII